MDIIWLFLIALGEIGLFIGLMYFMLGKRRGNMAAQLDLLRAGVEERAALLEKQKNVFKELIPVEQFIPPIKELKSEKDLLRAERGKLNISKSELETVENRLRELEEIERELEASGIETKEELNILKKKEGELRAKNDGLKSRVADSMTQMGKVMGQIEMSANQTEDIQVMKTKIVSTEEKIDTLILQIEQGNEHYFILKRRYDALDIEYAQLFEKFSTSEEMSNKDN